MAPEDVLAAHLLCTRRVGHREAVRACFEDVRAGRSADGLVSLLVARGVLDRALADRVEAAVARYKAVRASQAFGVMLVAEGLPEAEVRAALDARAVLGPAAVGAELVARGRIARGREVALRERAATCFAARLAALAHRPLDARDASSETLVEEPIPHLSGARGEFSPDAETIHALDGRSVDAARREAAREVASPSRRPEVEALVEQAFLRAFCPDDAETLPPPPRLAGGGPVVSTLQTNAAPEARHDAAEAALMPGAAGGVEGEAGRETSQMPGPTGRERDALASCDTVIEARVTEVPIALVRRDRSVQPGSPDETLFLAGPPGTGCAERTLMLDAQAGARLLSALSALEPTLQEWSGPAAGARDDERAASASAGASAVAPAANPGGAGAARGADPAQGVRNTRIRRRTRRLAGEGGSERSGPGEARFRETRRLDEAPRARERDREVQAALERSILVDERATGRGVVRRAEPARPEPAPQGGRAAPPGHAPPTHDPAARGRFVVDPQVGFPIPAWIDLRDPARGRRVAGHRLLGRIGAGGMGTVYLAVADADATRPVAIKLVASASPDVRGRFRREVLANGRFTHRGALRVSESGDLPGGEQYLILEFFDGRDVGRLIQEQGRLEPGRALAITAAVQETLVAAHAASVVHRDVKPDNILVDERGETRLVDFGIALVDAAGAPELDDELFRSVPGTVTGTLEYVSPEQAGGAPCGPASDVYSLGCTLFQMLAGRLPFSSSTPAGWLVGRVLDDPLTLRAACPATATLPREVHDLLARMLQRDPLDRPDDDQVLRALRHLRDRLSP